jgi:hypothetical protein
LSVASDSVVELANYLFEFHADENRLGSA